MPSWLQPRHALGRRRPARRTLLQALGVLLLLLGIAAVAARLDPLPPRFSGTAIASDGDSLRIGGDRVRLLGFDAPELDQVCWRADGTEWPCGRDARAVLAELTRRGPVTCRPEGEDRFGRTLARCESAGEDLGAAVVEAGYAVATDGYGTQQSAARGARRGIWQGRFTDPKTWRDEGPSNDPGPGLLEELWNGFRELTGARALR
jgi:endonuclease YncB( thermonuclease family)